MLRYEWKKMLWYQKGIVYICLFLAVKLVFFCFLGTTGNETLEQNRAAYDAYMEQVEGELTEEKREYLEAESLRLAEAKLELSQVQQSYYSGKISKEEYTARSAPLEADLAMQSGFDQIFSQYIYVRMAPEERYFLYTGGWDSILSAQSADYLGILLLMLLVIPVFCQEYSCGMDQLLVTSGGGARRQVRTKVIVCILAAAAIGAAAILMEYIWYGMRYGLPCGTYPLQSLESYQSVEKNLSLREAFLLQAGMKLFGYVYCAVIILFISSCVRKLSVSLVISTAVVLMPFLMVENYNQFTRVPGPWGSLVGTVFLSGTENSWNTYWQMYEVVSTELSWGEWGLILAAELCIMACLLYIMKKQNRNHWVSRGTRGGRKKGIGTVRLCVLSGLTACLLAGCGNAVREQQEGDRYLYNSDQYNYGETEKYLFYYDLSEGLICQDKETGERFDAVKEALYYSTDGLDGTIWLKDSVFAAGRYAYYFRVNTVNEYWNSSSTWDIFEVVRLDTENYSEETLYEINVHTDTAALMGLSKKTANGDLVINARQFFVDGEDIYLVEDGAGKVCRLNPRSGEEELLITLEKTGNVASDGEYIYYMTSAGLLALYHMGSGETRVVNDVVAHNFVLCRDGIYYLNLRDDNCIYHWDRETGAVTKLGDIRVSWMVCDSEYIYFVDQEAYGLYRMDQDGKNVVQITEEYPVMLCVFEGFDQVYMTVYVEETDEFRIWQIDKHTLEITETESAE